jgi:hypothetical protein
MSSCCSSCHSSTTLLITIIPKHVYAHQTATKLNRYEILNEEMDKACKLYWQTTPRDVWQTRTWDQGWTVSMDGVYISSKLEHTIVTNAQRKSALQYWNRRMGPNATALVHWTTTERTMAKLQRVRQIWTTKHVSGMFATGVRMKAWGKRDTATCPRCEDSEHVWTCCSIQAMQLWDQKLANMIVWLQAEHTKPSIIEEIIDGLNQWTASTYTERKQETLRRKRLPPTPTTHRQPTQNETTRHRATIIQGDIGWRAMAEGRIAKLWLTEQENHWARLGKLKSSEKWAANLTSQLLTIGWDLWIQRNNAVHNQEESKADEVMNAEITQLHLDGTQQRGKRLGQLFSTPLNTLLAKRTQQKRDWLTCTKAAIIRFEEKQKEQEQGLHHSRSIMYRFVGRQIRGNESWSSSRLGLGSRESV